MRPFALVAVLLLALPSSGCAVLKEQDIERRFDQIEQTLDPLAGEPKDVVLERIGPLELGEPVRVEALSASVEEYEFRRRYLGGVGGYDRVVLRFEDGRFRDYEVRGRR